MDQIQPQIQIPVRSLSLFVKVLLAVLLYIPTLLLIYLEFFSQTMVQSLLLTSGNNLEILGRLLILLLVPFALLAWSFKSYKREKRLSFSICIVIIFIWIIGVGIGSVTTYLNHKAFNDSPWNDPLYSPNINF